MNLKEIREECWDIAREVATIDSDRLWTKREMDRYINRVYRFIARETKCIRDAVPSSLTRITVTPYLNYADMQTRALTDPYVAEDIRMFSNTNSWFYVNPDPAGTYATRLDAMAQSMSPFVYSLSPLIVDIDEVKWTSKQWKLNKVSVNKWQVNPYWEQVRGLPTEYCTDYSNNTLAINFRADDTDTLRLIVRRLPLVDLINDTDSPEFRNSYHDFMINGVLAWMYRKQDSQTFDQVKAIDFEAKFKADVDEIKQQEVILDQRLRPNHSMDAFR